MLQHAPLLSAPIPGSSTICRGKLAPFTSKDKNPLTNLFMVKKKLLYSADKDNVVSSNKGGINWLTVSHSSIRSNCRGTVNANNEYYFTALLQRAFKTLMLRIPVKRRGEGEVGTPNRSHYQCPVLRCDPVFGWNFLLSIPGFPQFSPFRNPEVSPCSIHKHYKRKM